MNRQRTSPRKFSEKIALLNKKEAEHNAEFERIIKEVEETTRAPVSYPIRASSFSNCCMNRIEDIRRPLIEDQAYVVYNGNYGSQNQLYQCGNIDDNVQMPFSHQDQFHNARHNQPHSHQNTTLQQTSIIHDNATSPELPNIKISPTDDIVIGNQQVNYFNSNACLNQQPSTISSARSMPNITNSRLPGTSPHGFYCSTVVDNNHQPTANFTQMQNHGDNLWISGNNHFNNNNHLDSNGPNQDQFYHQGSNIVRANSFNTVSSCSWHNIDQSGTLSTPLDCNNLSKSFEGHYSLVEDCNSQNNCLCPTMIDSQVVNYQT